MRKRGMYSCDIYPTKEGVKDGFLVCEAPNKESAARQAWIYLGHMFDCKIHVRNYKGKIIFKTSFEGQRV